MTNRIVKPLTDEDIKQLPEITDEEANGLDEIGIILLACRKVEFASRLNAMKQIREWLKNNTLRGTYLADQSKEGWIISDYELGQLESEIVELELAK